MRIDKCIHKVDTGDKIKKIITPSTRKLTRKKTANKSIQVALLDDNDKGTFCLIRIQILN